MGLVVDALCADGPRCGVNVDAGVGHLRRVIDGGTVAAGVDSQAKAAGVHDQRLVLIADDVAAIWSIPLAIGAQGNRNLTQQLAVLKYLHSLGGVVH